MAENLDFDWFPAVAMERVRRLTAQCCTGWTAMAPHSVHQKSNIRHWDRNSILNGYRHMPPTPNNKNIKRNKNNKSSKTNQNKPFQQKLKSDSKSVNKLGHNELNKIHVSSFFEKTLKSSQNDPKITLK